MATLGSTLKGLLNKVYANQLIPGLTVSIDVTLSGSIGGTYEAESGNISGATSVNETRRAIVREVTIKEVVAGSPKAAVEQGDMIVKIKHDDAKTVPQTGLNVAIDGVAYRVLAVSRKTVDGSAVEYDCLCRK